MKGSKKRSWLQMMQRRPGSCVAAGIIPNKPEYSMPLTTSPFSPSCKINNRKLDDKGGIISVHVRTVYQKSEHIMV
jgi:hypothetical protein